MSENLGGVNMNAMGYRNQDLRDPEGGNNSRGVLGNVRPTGITARGRMNAGRSKSAERKGSRGGSRK